MGFIRMRRLVKPIPAEATGSWLRPWASRAAGLMVEPVRRRLKYIDEPSLNILTKLMAMVSVVFAGLVVKSAPIIVEGISRLR